MSFKKGHKVNLGSDKVGRKTIEEELEIYKEKIKKITLEELAESKLYAHLEKHTKEDDRQGLKDIALPIYNKSKPDKKEHTIKESLVKFINGEEDNNKHSD